jgi:hypothetical protein
MQNLIPPKPIPNILVLIALTGAVLFGWLTGHIIRFSIPAYQFQRSPTPEFNLHIKNGYEFELQGIRRLVVLTANSPMQPLINEEIVNFEGMLFGKCQGTIYYTSLPAKFHSVNGELVRVGEVESNIILFSPNK